VIKLIKGAIRIVPKLVEDEEDPPFELLDEDVVLLLFELLEAPDEELEEAPDEELF